MKRRIDLDKYKQEAVERVGGGLIAGDLVAIMNNCFELKDVLCTVAAGHNTLWVSNKKWNMHELLLGLLDITGPAMVHIATYAMSETPARVIAQLKEAAVITSLYCAIDNRVDTRSAGSLQLIMSIANGYALDDIHAKVTVIQNEKWSLTVIGSANYTVNKRVEAGIIMCTNEAAEQQLSWIKGLEKWN